MPDTKAAWGERAFLVAWIVGLVVLAWSGTRVDGYKLHVLDVPLPHPYPWSGVGAMAGVFTGELLVFYAVLRPLTYDRSWVRALAALGLALLLAAGFGATLMHGPPYMIFHWLLLAVGVVVLFVLACLSIVARLRR